MSFEELFNFTMQFSDCELLSLEEGHIFLKTIVNKSDANPYDMAHGGYLYTLCDNTAGVLGYSVGYYVVTQQASISYIASAKVDETLKIEGKLLHNGRSSKVAEVTITNESERLICKGTFTLFPYKKIEESNH